MSYKDASLKVINSLTLSEKLNVITIKLIYFICKCQELGFSVFDIFSHLKRIENAYNEKQQSTPIDILKKSLWLTSNIRTPSRRLFLWNSAYCLSNTTLFLHGGRTHNLSLSRSFLSIDLSDLSLNPPTSSNSPYLPITRLKPLKTPCERESHSLFFYSFSVYLFGGVSANNQYLNDLWLYNERNSEWESIKTTGSRPCGREGYSSNVCGDLWLVYSGRHRKILGDLYSLDLRSFMWQRMQVDQDQLTDLNFYKENASSAVFDSKFYIFGGNTENNVKSNELLEILIVNNDRAAVRALGMNSVLPPERNCASLVTYQNICLILFAGEGVSGSLNDLWIYSFTSHMWNEVVLMNTADYRMMHCAVLYQNYLIVVGGISTDCNVKGNIKILPILVEEDCTGRLTKINPKVVEPHSQAIQNTVYSKDSAKADAVFYDFPKENFVRAIALNLTELSELSAFFKNPQAALMESLQIFHNIKACASVNLQLPVLHDKICKLFPKHKIKGFSSLKQRKSDKEFLIRKTLLEEWKRSEYSMLNVVQVYYQFEMNYKEHAELFHKKNISRFLAPFLAISDMFLLVSMSKELLSVSFVERAKNNIQLVFLVFDAGMNFVFPQADMSMGALKYVLSKTHFTSADELIGTKATAAFIYTEYFKVGQSFGATELLKADEPMIGSDLNFGEV